MALLFSADTHFSHINIIRYCNRPFLKPGDLDKDSKWVSKEVAIKRTRKMNKVLIRNWNQRVKPCDTVIHIGDFCFCRGRAGSDQKAKYWEEKLNGDIVHINGNHDKNNGVDSLDSAIVSFGNHTFYLVHVPPKYEQIPNECDGVLCGHVHEKWLWENRFNIPVINVGVDQWKFMPVKKVEILKLYEKIKNANSFN